MLHITVTTLGAVSILAGLFGLASEIGSLRREVRALAKRVAYLEAGEEAGEEAEWR